MRPSLVHTIRATWWVLASKPKLRHAFFIPCDSHGINLLIKEILNLPSIVKIFTASKNVVSYFHTHARNHASLHQKQKDIYGKIYDFTTAVLTHGGLS